MWQYLIVWVVTTALSYLLAPRPKQQKPQPGQVEGPTASANAPIPVLFGTRWVKQPNCVWYGDIRVAAIKEKGGKK